MGYVTLTDLLVPLPPPVWYQYVQCGEVKASGPLGPGRRNKSILRGSVGVLLHATRDLWEPGEKSYLMTQVRNMVVEGAKGRLRSLQSLGARLVAESGRTPTT